MYQVLILLAEENQVTGPVGAVLQVGVSLAPVVHGAVGYVPGVQSSGNHPDAQQMAEKSRLGGLHMRAVAPVDLSLVAPLSRKPEENALTGQGTQHMGYYSMLYAHLLVVSVTAPGESLLKGVAGWGVVAAAGGSVR